jgi:ParB family chromosome partitioning protein
MLELANRVIREGISVRGLEELVAGSKPKEKKGKIVPGGRTDMLKEMAQELSDELNTVVKITLGRKKGQLVIEFGNIADLRRIAEQIKGN